MDAIGVRKKRPFWALSNLNLFTPRSPIGVGFPCCVAESVRARMRSEGHDVQHAIRCCQKPHLLSNAWNYFFFGWGTPETSSAMLNDVVCFWHTSVRTDGENKHHSEAINMCHICSYIIKKKMPHETIWKIDHQANLHGFEAYISKPDEWFLKMLEPPAEGNHCPELLRGVWWMKETWRHAMSDVATRLQIADLLLQCSWSLDVFRCLSSLHMFHLGF